MSDLSINNRCPDCRIVLNSSGKCQRCKRQVKTKPPINRREKSGLGKLHGEAFFAEFDRVFKVKDAKLSREAMEWWDNYNQYFFIFAG